MTEFKFKHLGPLLKETFIEWNDKDPFRQSAVIAYYAIFSIPGLLVLIIAIAGYFFGVDAVNENIINQISDTIGTETALQIKETLEKSSRSRSTTWGSVVGIVILLVGATGVFVELQKTLNLIWNVKLKPQNSFITILKARLFSFGLILAIAFLLIISLVISAAVSAFGNWILVDTLYAVNSIIIGLKFVISLGVMTALFALIFKILPDAKIKWQHVWLGSLLTGLLFAIGETILSYYFGKVEPASVYGAAGSIILILLWVSYSSMILFFGAEFTAAFARKYSGVVPPTPIAKIEIPTEREKSL